MDGDGRLTGRLAGPNCRADEKVRRLAALFGDPPVLDWAYGDSPDDRAMLARATHPVEVGSDALVGGPGVTVTASRPTNRLGPIITELRPRQWAKNLLVVAAPAGAQVLTEFSTWWRLILAFAAFCAASSSIYVVNDLADIESDRRHPTKRYRPIAAGLVSVSPAAPWPSGSGSWPSCWPSPRSSGTSSPSWRCTS